MKILILHPDLGIGGAERLILDIALGLKQKNHEISILTNHYDQNHSFQETKNGQLSQIKSVGDWIPRSILGRFFYAFFAYLRFLYLTFYVIFQNLPADLIICDQIPIGIPLLKIFNYKVLFYCHFPDQLLTNRNSLLKKLYRYPIDLAEELSMSYADKILVNSDFTASTVRKTFKTSRMSIKDLNVLYPCISQNCLNLQNMTVDQSFLNEYFKNQKECIFLSINRYERKKNIDLAIKAFNELIKSSNCPERFRQKLGLIIAGGYDPRISENVGYHADLTKLASDLGLEVGRDIVFLKSVSDEIKFKLLSTCSALIYTPRGEHFGIVPLEASAQGKPVIAVNDGGPCETVISGKTGYLCEPSPSAFAVAMLSLIRSMDERQDNGSNDFEKLDLNKDFDKDEPKATKSQPTLPNRFNHTITSRDCIDHVMKNFSFDIFADKLSNIVIDMVK